jgi:CRP/FNR family transcriptional regulator
MISTCLKPHWLGRSDCRHCAVRGSALFAHLPREVLDSFLAPVNHFFLPARTRLLGPDETANAVITIRKGFVKLEALSVDGNRRIIRLLGPGDVVGLEALHAPTYLHVAESITAIDACHIPTVLIHDLEARFPELHGSLVERWHRSLQQADRFILELLEGPAPSRIARLLLMLATLAGDSPVPRLSRQDTAAAVNIAPETASRIVTRFIDEGIVIEQLHDVRLDLAALVRIAAG